MTARRNLSAYIVDEATPEQMARQWVAVESRLGDRPRRVVPVSLFLAGAAAAAIVYVLANRTVPTGHWTSQAAPESFALADGSRVELQPSTDVTLLGQSEVEDHLQVVRGGARFEVRRNPTRRFQVSAAGIDVVVTGTVFSVSLDGDSAAPRVSVERGEVEVRRRQPPALLARLHAGQSWPPVAPIVEPSQEVAATSPPEVKVEPEPPPAANPARGLSRATPDPQPAATDPRRLLERANAARRSGNAAQAADALEALRSHYPRDKRAALASFELGRLRMDELGDLAGAVEALQHSIALAPHGVFREDAEACLATAFARQHQRGPCENARRAYLDRYPEGTHAAAMAALDCGR